MKANNHAANYTSVHANNLIS